MFIECREFVSKAERMGPIRVPCQRDSAMLVVVATQRGWKAWLSSSALAMPRHGNRTSPTGAAGKGLDISMSFLTVAIISYKIL